MIGAVELSSFGACVGTNRQAELFGRCFYRWKKCGSLCSGDFDFFGGSKRLHVVVVQIQRNFSCWDRWMFAEIFRSEQALFFGGDGGKKNGASRPLSRRAIGSCQLEQNAASGGI